jgi:hypothetical protein
LCEFYKKQTNIKKHKKALKIKIIIADFEAVVQRQETRL